MTTDLRQDSYNKFTNYSHIPYNITQYLMENNNLIFKLLKFSDNKPYEKPNLTLKEKGELIYQGQKEITNYNIFFSEGQDDSWTKETTILRIVNARTKPIDYVKGTSLILFEVFPHLKVDTMFNYDLRQDTIIQQLLETLNGADIPLVGRLVFDLKYYSCEISLIGSIPFRGKALTMMCLALG